MSGLPIDVRAAGEELEEEDAAEVAAAARHEKADDVRLWLEHSHAFRNPNLF